VRGRAAAAPRAPRKAPPASTGPRKQPAAPASTGSPSSPNDGDPDPAPRGPGRVRVELGSAGRQGAGFVLGLMVWGWVALPFLKGGPSEVKKVLMAKFLNKAPNGAWLP
jgi:hypothetical protein